jgi:hypothetical protein
MTKHRICLAASLIALSVPLIANASGTALVGVVEEPQCKDQAGVFVRPLFKKDGSSWSPLDSEHSAQGLISPRMHWVIGLDGRQLAAVDTIDPGFSTAYSWTYPRDRLLMIAPEARPPEIPNKAQQFTGWCQAPERRPLAALADGSIADPDAWKPLAIKSGDAGKLLSAFRQQAGAASLCPAESARAVPFKYGAKDVEVLKSYGDRNGRRLITLSLKQRKDVCDGPPDTAWKSHTFLLAKKTTYLGPGLTVVDAGDYDSDGKSEVLFWYTGYDEDGYVLLPGDSGQLTRFLWKYR